MLKARMCELCFLGALTLFLALSFWFGNVSWPAWIFRIRFTLKSVFLTLLFVSLALTLWTPSFRRLQLLSRTRHRVFNELDYESIRDAGRRLISATPNGSLPTRIEPNQLPDAISETEPVFVSIELDVLTIEYGDEHDRFGLRIYPAGHKTYLWYKDTKARIKKAEIIKGVRRYD